MSNTVLVSMRIDEDHLEELKRLGDGNKSLGFRLMFDVYERSRARAPVTSRAPVDQMRDELRVATRQPMTPIQKKPGIPAPRTMLSSKPRIGPVVVGKKTWGK